MEEVSKLDMTPKENANKELIDVESEEGKKIKSEIYEYKDSNTLEIIMFFEED